MGLLALGFGSGLIVRAPGTFGSLLGLALWWPATLLPIPQQALVIAVAFLIGIPVCAYAARRLGQQDPGSIVFDEFVGQWIALIVVPLDWRWWIAAFLAFRLFDITKPWPVSMADREVHGGLGVMLDDGIAGLMAAASLVIAQFVLLQV